MAGNYPDVPDQRMAYDRDGTVLASYDKSAGTVTELANSVNVTVNNESSDYYVLHSTSGTYGVVEFPRALVILFPEPRDIVAFAANVNVSNFQGTAYVTDQIDVSTNTTNGLDGTWTTIQDPWQANYSYDKTYLRDGIVSLTGANAVVAIRFHWHRTYSGATFFRLYNLHLFGQPSTGEAPNRLRFWHPTLDEEVDGAYFDWGDIPRSTTVDRDFRIKNPSATLTAETVGLTMEAATDTTPSNVGQHSFSTDGVAFTSTADLGDLAPDTISSVVTLRRATAPDAAFALWWTRIVASASAWV